MNGIKSHLLFVLLLVVGAAVAETGTIKGLIKNAEGPLPFANVFLDKTPHAVYSNNSGNYKLENVEYGTYELVVQLLGYQTFRKKIELNSSSLNVDVQLKFSSKQIDEVVVSGTLKSMSKSDSPLPVEVYSQSFFQKNPAPSIFEAMSNINGVRPQLNCNVCNTGDIHINGLEGPYTMIMIDGMPIVSGLSTVYGLMGIPQSLIERVEIVKGPASTLYGSEAVGGIINVITKSPQSAPRLSADFYSSTWGEVNSDIGVKFQPAKKVNSLLGVNYYNFSNKVDNNNDGITDLTLQDRISVFNKLSFRLLSPPPLGLRLCR